MKRRFLPAAARARGQSNDLNREILASNLFDCCKEVIYAPPVPSISRCIHIVYQHKNVWEYQWSNFIYNCMSTFLHFVHCKDALLDCSAPGGERCESLTRVDEIPIKISLKPGQHQAIIWTSAGILLMMVSLLTHIYASLGLNESASVCIRDLSYRIIQIKFMHIFTIWNIQAISLMKNCCGFNTGCYCYYVCECEICHHTILTVSRNMSIIYIVQCFGY